MKNKQRILFALLLAIPAATTVVSSVNALEKDGRSLYDVVKERGEFWVGNRQDYPPFGFLGKDGSNIGIDIELSKYCAAKLGVKRVVKQVSSSSRIPMLLNGEIDAFVAATNPTSERAKVIDFTAPYYSTGLALMVPTDSKIKNLDDLAGKRVAGVQGSNDMKNLLKRQPKADALYFQEHPQAVLAVVNGKADAYFTTVEILIAFQQKTPGKLKIIMPPVIPETFAIGLRQNDTKWRVFLEECIMEATKDGSLDRWAKDYAGRDLDWHPMLYVNYYQ